MQTGSDILNNGQRATQQGLRLAVVGATGAVGNTLLDLLEERRFPFETLFLVASVRSAGRKVHYRRQDYEVHDLEHFAFDDIDIAFFSAGTTVSREHARRAARAGCVVIDNTNAFRMMGDVPLIVPQVNGHLLCSRPPANIIANPNCSTIPIVRVIQAIQAEYPVKKLIVATYQAASGAGASGISELQDDCARYLNGQTVLARRFPVPLGFNVIPSIDVHLMNGFTLEEQKMLQESRKILAMPELKVSATTVRVPVINGHSAAVYFECTRAIDPERVSRLIENAPEHILYSGRHYPTPRFMERRNSVHVGRVRRDPCDDHAGWFWVVSDNLRIGAALNAIQIAEAIVEQGVLRS